MAGNLAAVLKQRLATTGAMDPRAEPCLSWAFTSYRGALISIPSELVDASIRSSTMFFMANANRDQEKTFADKLVFSGGGDSLIVFHGTKSDRLYPILHNGLRTQVQPGMMQWGKVLGSGIHTARDSSVAMGYENFSKPVPALQGACITFYTVLMLICELAEPQKYKRATQDPRTGKQCDVLVATDPSYLILRAVVLARPGLELPPVKNALPHRMVRRLR
ncbi:uncharacterized protein A1O9_10848 [Exophiala aquamarina CBS 119918]|uniref:PARP catalytic domain-containing protein n=1 Tax=Exophiala aquamarina CBS 119918 TaxID=1182545 RepID=A0A072NZU4_9EURO|nr:uncharacterized protein A1O9_10848 [Exophiala aquamarina CBS 119918]KEF52942.1 hypothetical protein A1O9_10848 [Exophiala aquamarina CBS 119918]